MSGHPIAPARDGVRIALKVIPRASKTTLGDIRDGRLLIRVTAPPVDSAANDAVTSFLAKALGVSKRDVKLVTGETSRLKTVEVTGLTAGDASVRLGFGGTRD